ncbi:MAG TPA: NUDIX hydrolase [Candidatus Saccharimonadales bacterium]|nr:NUDIX hydrolase [Candidatus Saccharimonadales bacterium]
MNVWTGIGRIGYWLTWPLLWVYLRDSHRTRLVLINDTGKLLVVRGWVADSSRWSLPGGGLHRGEEPQHGLLREVHEEVGLTLAPDKLRLLKEMPVHIKGFHFYVHIFMATITGEPTLHLQRFEITDAQWIDYHTLNEKNAESDLLLALVGLPVV